MKPRVTCYTKSALNLKYHVMLILRCITCLNLLRLETGCTGGNFHILITQPHPLEIFRTLLHWPVTFLTLPNPTVRYFEPHLTHQQRIRATPTSNLSLIYHTHQ